MDGNMALTIALTLLSISAPITAAYATRKHKDGNGFSTRELSAMATNVNWLVGAMKETQIEIKQIWAKIRPV